MIREYKIYYHSQPGVLEYYRACSYINASSVEEAVKNLLLNLKELFKDRPVDNWVIEQIILDTPRSQYLSSKKV